MNKGRFSANFGGVDLNAAVQSGDLPGTRSWRPPRVHWQDASRVRRSTLADASERRDWRIYAEFARANTYPNFWLHGSGDHMHTMRITPIDVTTISTMADWLVDCEVTEKLVDHFVNWYMARNSTI